MKTGRERENFKLLLAKVSKGNDAMPRAFYIVIVLALLSYWPLAMAMSFIHTDCPAGRYGSYCELECNCPRDDTCHKETGVCASGRCHDEWTGPQCQIRLPKLTNPPAIVNSSCERLSLLWRRWDPTLDTGDPYPTTYDSYTIQRAVGNSSEWIDVQDIEWTDTDGQRELVTVFEDVDPGEWYSFRIRVNTVVDGEILPGIPGPAIFPPVKAAGECFDALVSVAPAHSALPVLHTVTCSALIYLASACERFYLHEIWR